MNFLRASRYAALSCAGIGLITCVSLAQASTPDLPSCDVWELACHYTSSNRESSYDINRVVIHKTEGGSAAGAASWFTNCASGGSAHFVFDKSNGYCYQCVREADIAWHAGYSSTNNNSIGIEHSGWTANNDTSSACYQESAIETRSCVIYYGVPANRSYIIGHSEVPGCSGYGGGVNCHTDPGPYWDWNYYMSLVNNGYTVGGAIAVRYNQLGGANGILGPPITNELTCPDGVGKYNHFQNGGSIYWTPSTGAWEVYGSIRAKWEQLGWETGVCGYPTTGETSTPDGIGRYNHFSKGASIYWTQSTGAHEVGGAIHSKWEQLGWETGVCGYPLIDETGCPDGVGRYNHFSKGSSIYWTPSTGAHQVGGAIRNHWESLGWETSSLGYPTSDEYSVGPDRRNDFQGGTITWHSATGTTTVP
jgi:N-acetyl-anhydromuramyl-L-alanine amidase AmpD